MGGIRTTVRSTGPAPPLTWFGIVVASLLAGALAAGRAEVWFGQTFSLLLLATILAGAVFAVSGQVGASVVLWWPVAAVVGYVIVQLPRRHAIITFDRVWIGAMLAYLLLERPRAARARANSFVAVALLWLTVSFGVRSFATSAGLTGPVATWIDAIVLPMIIFFACRRFSVSLERVQRIAVALMLAGGILGGLGIAERIFGFELATLTGGAVRFDAEIDQTRVSGPYPVPEPYALVLIVCFAATLYWMQTRKPRPYFWGLLFAGLELGGIGLSLFRAAWVGAIVVFIASFGLRRYRHGRTIAVGGVVAVAAIAATWQLENNKTFSTRVNNTDNIYGRLATYEQGLGIFRSSPLFGVGVNQYHSVSQTRGPQFVSGVQSVTYPHSSYIGLLAEQGIVGLLPFLFLTFAVWRVIRGLGAASVTDEIGALTGTLTGAAVAYLIMSLTLTMLPYEPSNAFFAVLLGAGAGMLDSLTSAEHRRH